MGDARPGFGIKVTERLGNGAASHWNRSKRTRRSGGSESLEGKSIRRIPYYGSVKRRSSWRTSAEA